MNNRRKLKEYKTDVLNEDGDSSINKKHLLNADTVIKFLTFLLLCIIFLFFVIAVYIKYFNKDVEIKNLQLIKIDKNLFAVNEYNKDINLNIVMSNENLNCLNNDMYCVFKNESNGLLIKIKDNNDIVLYDKDGNQDFFPFYKLCDIDNDCQIFINKDNSITVIKSNKKINPDNQNNFFNTLSDYLYGLFNYSKIETIEINNH